MTHRVNDTPSRDYKTKTQKTANDSRYDTANQKRAKKTSCSRTAATPREQKLKTTQHDRTHSMAKTKTELSRGKGQRSNIQ